MRVRSLLIMFVMLGSTLPAIAEHGSAAISGTVTNSQAEPLANICVTANDTEDGEWSYGSETAADGSYFIEVVEGDYAVQFYDCSDNGYLEQWYDGKSAWWNADRVTVGSDQHVTGIDAVMAKGGSITGTISLEDQGWTDASVYAWSQDGFGSTEVSIDGSDTFTISGLPAGDYTVQFQPYSSGYVAEFYDDVLDEVDATLVTVATEQVTEGIDAELAPGGSIAGRVSDDEGFAANNACVDAYRPDGSWMGSGYSWSDGRYEVRGLPTGAYKVQFSDCDSGELASEWYDDAATAAAATEVAVIATEVTRDIDAELGRGSGPDISIDRVWVTPVPLETDLASVPGTGLQRTVHALVSNRGNEGGEAAFFASATSVSDRKTQTLVDQWARVKAGETVELTFAWNGTGMVGDALIKVLTCPERDTRWRNNTATVRSYVGVGGTGSGYTIAAQNGGEPECWGGW